ncbi:MAG: metal ABC transporter permease [Euryarchaeota archaeon]|nr:metal ABC transporter permease [Euryarchaeota archaeon]
MRNRVKVLAAIAVATTLAILASVMFSDYYPFIKRMFLAGILASLACGVVGTFVVVRRIVFMSDAIAHSTFGGIGLAFLLQSVLGWVWLDPMLGAALFAIGAAIILSMGWTKTSVREDSVIGILWVIGMAMGVLFYSLVDPRKVTLISPESILFGSILLINENTLWMMLALLVVIYVVVLFLFKDLQILTFDEEFARISGINVTLTNFILLALVALTIVALIKLVGIILAIAMLTIPAAVAGTFNDDLKSMMLSAVIISLILTTAGSFTAIILDIPPGATIVLLMGAVFLVVLMVRSWFTNRKVAINQEV